MNRWHVYSYLKVNNGVMGWEFTEKFFKMDLPELLEGIAEYELMAQKEPEYYKPINWNTLAA